MSWTTTDEESIYTDGTRFRVRVSMLDERGKQKERKRTLKTGQTMEDAIRIRNQLRRKLEEVITQPKPLQMPSLNDYAERWIARKAERLKPGVIEQHISTLSSYVLPVLGDIRLDQLVRDDIEGWVAWCERQTLSDGRLYADSTLDMWWRTGRQIIQDAMADHDLRDPTRRVTKPKNNTVPRKETRTLGFDELGDYLEAIKQFAPQRYAEVATLAYTGMRVGEMYGLDWKDIDLDRELITIRKSFSHGHLTTPKTGIGREVYVTPLLADILGAHRKEQMREQAPGLEQGIVFPSTVGTRRHGSSLRKAMQLAEDASGVDVHVTPQVLRRTFNTLAVSAGVDRIVLRSQMGHTSEQMTARYAGVSVDQKRAGIRHIFGD
jgi:integrase